MVSHVHKFMPISIFSSEMKWESAVGQNDRTEVMDEEDDLWTATTDSPWLKGYKTTLYPCVILTDQEKGLYSDLEKALDSKMVQILWSATLLLASRI